MARRGVIIAGALVFVVAGAGFATRNLWTPDGVAKAQGPARPPPRAVPVDVAVAQRGPVPVQIDALGTVMPFASVAIKARLETEITGVHFIDGQEVKQGDLLFTLDSRALEAQIAQAEGVVLRDKAQLEGAERDVRRYTELVAKNAGTQVSLDNAKTAADTARGTLRANEAALTNLRVQLSYTKITAPITGRISAANVKVGNFVRPADLASLATINQIRPVYAAFAVPQRQLGDIRQALQAGSAKVSAQIPSDAEPSSGKLAMVDNTVDATTGMAMARAIFDNQDEALWPGSLVNTILTLRTEDAVTLPTAAVNTGQTGPYVFVVENGTAKVRPVRVSRTMGAQTVIAEGLSGGETIVLDGQMLLSDGSKVAPRAPRTGS
ncbi:MAG: rane fusion protein multidrug efflux system [Variibacter sp.]|nr:rane fusion protein multidrug efflux system [Variibacter sp.]